MSHSVLVDPQHPPRPETAKRLWRWFHYPRGHDIISVALIIGVFIKGRERHFVPQCNDFPVSLHAHIFVGKAEKFAKQTVRVSLNA